LGNLADWAERRKKSKYIPWKQELRGNFKMSYSMQKGKLTYDRSRPSRRQPVPEIMFPALRAPRPKIGIAFDVSGSNLGNIRLMSDELVNIMKASGVRGTDVQAFAVDTVASDTKIVNNPLTVLDNLVGGGGTRMKPGYEKLAELGNDLSILVTDGYVDDFPKEMPKGKGKKRSKYITCIILEGEIKGDPHDHPLMVDAKKYLGKWGKVIPIVVTAEERAKAGY
jgi:predicted metal-dependent peptidase